MDYVATDASTGDCFICRAGDEDDDEANLVVDRTELSIILLNKYPYNTGHLIVSPKRHVGEITELTLAERTEIMNLLIAAVGRCRQEMKPEGFNLGANLGEVAGAGLPGHFHMHVVPRWSGDTNFMPVVGEAKVIPEILKETFRRLRGKIASES